ncbi:MAG: hypothetical protein QXN45_04715 [Candidatus Thermoplasmatota archaeon]
MKKELLFVGICFSIILASNSSAISWGKIDATPSSSIAYVERYGQEEISLDVVYSPYLLGFMPIYVDVSATYPDWLTVASNPQTFVLKPGEHYTVKVLLKVSKHDVVAGTSSTVEISLTGRLITGGALRQIDEAKVTLVVGYNPFTEIAIRSVTPIERTAPDRELTFIVEVVNYGNSRVIVNLYPEKEPDGWNYVISPPQVVIDPKKAGDETFPYETVKITLTSPHGTAISYHNKWQDFAISAKATSETPYWVKRGGTWSRSTEEIELVNTHTVTAYFLAKNRGFYIPGFDSILLIAGIFIAFLLLRKRK